MAIPAYYSLIQKGSYGPDEALVQTWLNGVRDQCSYYPALTIDCLLYTSPSPRDA